MAPYGTLPYFLNVDSAGGNYYLDLHTNASRFQSLVNLFLLSHQWLGRHDFKFGADLDRISYDAQFARLSVSYLSGNDTLTSPDLCLTAPQDSSFPCTRYSTFTPAPLHEQYNAEFSAYVEDRWSIRNRLLIEPGVRLDWDEIVRHAEFAPRLAGTYVLDNSGHTKISAGIGLIYEETPIFLIARPYAGGRQDTFFSVNPNCTTSTGCVTTTGPIATTFSADANALNSPRFINWSVGLEKKLPASIYVRLNISTAAAPVDSSTTRATTQPAETSSSRTPATTATKPSRSPSAAISAKLCVDGPYTRSSAHSNQALDFKLTVPFSAASFLAPIPGTPPTVFYPGDTFLYSSCR